jgi:methionyl-tRNA formyltransferase
VPIRQDDTTETLTATLAELGAVALGDAIRALRDAGITPRPQDAAQATYAPRLTKEDGRIDWRAPADAIARAVRAFAPWPSAYTTLAGRTVKIHAARALGPVPADTAPPGTIVVVSGTVRVVTGAGALELVTVQAEGKKALPAAAFAAGARLGSGARFE